MILAILSVGSIASGQAFWDDFESYAAGEFLNDVDGWHGWDDTAGAGSPVSDAQAYSGSNSLEIIGDADLVHEYDIAGGKWVLSAVQYIPSGTTGVSWFILLNTYNDGANAEKVWSSETQFNLGTGAITVPQDTSASADILYDQWITIKCVIDLDENTIDKYYDEILISTHVWDSTNHGTIGAIDLFGNGASSVFYDDIKIQSYQMSLSGADGPVPAPAAVDVPRDSMLTWAPGVFDGTHNVYFGTSFEDIESGTTPTATLDVNSFDPGRLEFGQTYYWRVDEVNDTADKTVFKGKIWSFTAEPYAVQIPASDVNVTGSSSSNEFSSPATTTDGSGLDENGVHATEPETMWFTQMADPDPWIQFEFDGIKKLDTMTVWNSNSAAEAFLGYGVKGVEIAYSAEGETWDILVDVNEFSRAPGLPSYDQPDTIDFGGVAAKIVRLNIQSNWGDVMPSYSLSEVQFNVIPAAARTPVPVSDATGVRPDDVVSWRAGREAAQSTVYASTDANDVIAGVAPSATSNTNSISLSSFDLQMGQTYYWRVDEVNDAEAISTWAGPVWSLTVATSLVVDDFEDYSNDSPNRPFQAWLDGFGYSADEFFPAGYGGNGTGAGIGHDIWSVASEHYNGDIMETTSAMPGSTQSMPFYYGNSGGVASQTERTFAVPQDCTVGGAQTLSIAFSGQAGNTGTLYVKINNTKLTYPRAATNMAIGAWQAWNIDLSSLNVQAVTKLQIGVNGSNASGMILIDDIRLHAEAGKVITPTDPGNVNWVGAWNLDEGSGTTTADNSGSGHTGTIVGATWDAGQQGSALLFGETAYVETGFAGVTGTESRTCSAWVKTTEANRTIMSWGLNTAGRKWRMRLDVTGGLRVEVNGGYHYGQAFLADDEWHHVAVVLEDDGTADCSETLLYVDGRSESTSAVLAKAIDTDPTGEVRIGKSPYHSSGFIGLIDDARIYDRALSEEEILSLAGVTAPIDKPF